MKGENDGCISTRVYEGGVNTEGFGKRESCFGDGMNKENSMKCCKGKDEVVQGNTKDKCKHKCDIVDNKDNYNKINNVNKDDDEYNDVENMQVIDSSNLSVSSDNNEDNYNYSNNNNNDNKLLNSNIEIVSFSKEEESIEC